MKNNMPSYTFPAHVLFFEMSEHCFFFFYLNSASHFHTLSLLFIYFLFIESKNQRKNRLKRYRKDGQTGIEYW